MNKIHYRIKSLIFTLMISSLFNSCISVDIRVSEKKQKMEKVSDIQEKPQKTNAKKDYLTELQTAFKKKVFSFLIPGGSKIDTVIIDNSAKSIEVKFNKKFIEQSFRYDNIDLINKEIKNFLGSEFSNYNLVLKSKDYLLSDLIPNFYRKSYNDYDESRINKSKKVLSAPLIRNISKNFEPTKGLMNRNIVLWHSHGWYYANEGERWEWQRPRLFENIEDLGPMSFTLPYIIPMLENAGATCFIPRERDIQLNEIIIDNDSKTDIKNKNYSEKISDKKIKFINGTGNAFLNNATPYSTGYNPFEHGTHRIISSDTKQTALAQFTPEVKETGTYGVYVSYISSEKNATDVKYTVNHLGGKTEFLVNQTVGGKTWLFLGFFNFKNGKNLKEGSVEISNLSREKGKLISVDAVRFGGGFGVVERGGAPSGRPKFTEGARYYLQFLGMPDTLVYSFSKNKNDYRDDYVSRNEYANYLNGAPAGPNRDRNNKGLGIPVDISFAFHTDAGITRNDTVVGTLSIFSSEDVNNQKNFPDGSSRMANRDLADILQTQICDDIKSKYDITWNRRQLMDADYAESVRPNMPSVLLELLSHQNMLDMKFLQDPRFRFDVSRSIYKAFVKFIASQNKSEYVIAPLPVSHFSAEFETNGNALLKWKPTEDKLEPTALPSKYIIYTRIGHGGFDNGIISDRPATTISNIKPNTIYSFKVTAINAGGESLPSEILSVYRSKTGSDPLLIVNGFDRICGPATVETDKYSGFLSRYDFGVPDKNRLNFSGYQYDFNPDSPWLTNDAPGWGANTSEYETGIVAGNTFDFVYDHGKVFASLGKSFVSCSKKAFEEKLITSDKYKFIDLIFGKEKETNWPKPYGDSVNGLQFRIFTSGMISVLNDYLNSGGSIFLSGCYIAKDVFKNLNSKDSSEIHFVKDKLKYLWNADFACTNGLVNYKKSFSASDIHLRFNTLLSDKIYFVESAGSILPVKDSKVLMYYHENEFPAVTGYKGKYRVVAAGFPFETILSEKDKVKFMRSILEFLNMK